MRKYVALLLALVCVLALVGCQNSPNTPAEIEVDIEYDDVYAPTKTRGAYTYEELSEMPAEELLDLFIQNGLVINDDLKASFTEEELQTLFKENFDLWHTGVSAHSHTMYCDLAEQTKAIYDKIAKPSPLSNELSEIPGGTTHVVDIWDRTKTEQIACDTALEKFWEDETNEYYFSVIKSQHVVVTYNDGSSEDIVTALNAGRVTMADLDKFEIEYRIEPKVYTIERDNNAEDTLTETEKIPSINEVSQMKYNEVNEVLSGKEIQEIRDAWGEPVDSDGKEDVWQLDKFMLLIVAYNNAGIIESCELVSGTPLAPAE